MVPYLFRIIYAPKVIDHSLPRGLFGSLFGCHKVALHSGSLPSVGFFPMDEAWNELSFDFEPAVQAALPPTSLGNTRDRFRTQVCNSLVFVSHHRSPSDQVNVLVRPLYAGSAYVEVKGKHFDTNRLAYRRAGFFFARLKNHFASAVSYTQRE